MMMTSSSSVSRRSELEQVLENDIAELAQLQESLVKTNILTDRMGGMLTSFEDRLAKLESSILPIHKATKSLTKLHENIEKSVDYVDEIVGYLSLAAREDLFISKGPTDNLTEYLTVVSKLKSALNHLNSLNFRSGEMASQKLRLTLTKANFHLDTLFKRKLVSQSTPIDVSQFELDVPLPKISDSDLEDLVLLTGQLAGLDQLVGESGNVFEHVRTFSETRSAFFNKSLAAIASLSNSMPRGSSATYVKGSSPFIKYMHFLMRLCKNEKALIQKLIIKPQAQTCFLQTITSATEKFTETGESLVSRVKRSVVKREYTDLYMLIDVSANLADHLKQYDHIVAYAGNKGAELSELVSNSKITIMFFFRDFTEELKQPETPKSILPVDGTVHEIASITLNIIRRLIEFEPSINQMLTEGWGANLSASTLKALVKELLHLLYVNLENKSKIYKRAILGNVFLINNYNYIMKQIKLIGSEAVGAECEVEFEKGFNKQKEAYKGSWTPCYQVLMEQTKIEGGAIVKTLTKQQREGVKERFKNFNGEIDGMYVIQKSYTIADADLRAQILNEIKDILMPLYTNFLSHHTASEFTKNPSKYIKYDKAALEAILDGFFVGSSDPSDKKFFTLPGN
ncbi:Cullin repeat-like-containing domain protein [Chytriomyces sp. MP71]|nr:Cullin repeat-like-containing domain protein [Chytriomyces sp. MP71]